MKMQSNAVDVATRLYFVYRSSAIISMNAFAGHLSRQLKILKNAAFLTIIGIWWTTRMQSQDLGTVLHKK